MKHHTLNCCLANEVGQCKRPEISKKSNLFLDVFSILEAQVYNEMARTKYRDIFGILNKPYRIGQSPVKLAVATFV